MAQIKKHNFIARWDDENSPLMSAGETPPPLPDGAVIIHDGQYTFYAYAPGSNLQELADAFNGDSVDIHWYICAGEVVWHDSRVDTEEDKNCPRCEAIEDEMTALCARINELHDAPPSGMTKAPDGAWVSCPGHHFIADTGGGSGDAVVELHRIDNSDGGTTSVFSDSAYRYELCELMREYISNKMSNKKLTSTSSVDLKKYYDATVEGHQRVQELTLDSSSAAAELEFDGWRGDEIKAGDLPDDFPAWKIYEQYATLDGVLVRVLSREGD